MKYYTHVVPSDANSNSDSVLYRINDSGLGEVLEWYSNYEKVWFPSLQFTVGGFLDSKIFKEIANKEAMVRLI